MVVKEQQQKNWSRASLVDGSVRKGVLCKTDDLSLIPRPQ